MAIDFRKNLEPSRAFISAFLSESFDPGRATPRVESGSAHLRQLDVQDDQIGRGLAGQGHSLGPGVGHAGHHPSFFQAACHAHFAAPGELEGYGLVRPRFFRPDSLLHSLIFILNSSSKDVEILNSSLYD
jgi:hypothetical protein